MKKIVVIGAGYAGLATSALLAHKGFEVTVVEKNDQPGGRAMLWKDDGFEFDMGPSWYLMPDVFERFFSIFKKTPADYYSLTRLDPNYRIFLSPEEHYDVPSEPDAVSDLFERLEKGGAEKFREYLGMAEYQYNIAMKKFLYRRYDSITDVLDPQLIFEGLKLNIFQNMADYTKRYFKSDVARKILEYNLVFLGGAPSETPALYSLMAHVDFNLGVWYPQGGLNAIAQGVHKLGQELGVTYRFNSEVNTIVTKNGKVTGVFVGNELLSADCVVASADYQHVETTLLNAQDQTYPPNYWERKTVAPSALLLYLGINKRLPNLLHHTLYFEHQWENHFSDIFDRPAWPQNPNYYICTPSLSDNSVAPEGCENVFVLVPLAPGLTDSDSVREEFADKIISHMETLIGEKFRENIIVKRIFSHRDFSSLFNAYKGTALGLSHTLFQTAVFRPHMKSKKVENLYYAGNYTHPGIGVPMQFIGAEIVSDTIQWSYER